MSQATDKIHVHFNSIYDLDYHADSSSYLKEDTPFCMSGVKEYETYGHTLCGTVKYESATCTVLLNPGSFTLNYSLIEDWSSTGGIYPIGGDSGAPAWTQTTLMALQTTVGTSGCTSKAKNIDVYFPMFDWIVPGH